MTSLVSSCPSAKSAHGMAFAEPFMTAKVLNFFWVWACTERPVFALSNKPAQRSSTIQMSMEKADCISAKRLSRWQHD